MSLASRCRPGQREPESPGMPNATPRPIPGDVIRKSRGCPGSPKVTWPPAGLFTFAERKGPPPGWVSHGLLLPSPFPLVADRQDPCDLPLRRPQPRAVVERARRGLEAEVEELLPALAERPLELVVGHVAELPSFQRDQPLSSRSWS